MIDPGVPIVFLHAYPLNASMWDAQRAAFTHRQLLAPDFPGFGGRPPGARTLDGFAESVLEDMDSAGIDRAVFVGLSLGGYVAFRIHARWPRRVAGVVFADTRSGPDSVESASKRTEQAERVQREGVGWLPETVIPAILGETTRRDRPEVVARIRRMILDANAEGVARALLAMRDRPDSTDSLPKIGVPVLAMAGAEDTLTPVEEARRIADGTPNGSLVVVPAAGHLSNLENPQAFNSALREFLD
jgi:3-oxoadipate enol-lactonase